MKLNKKQYFLIGLLLAVICFVYISVRGDVIKETVTVPPGNDPANYVVEIEDETVISLEDITSDGSTVTATFRAVSPGTTYVDFVDGTDPGKWNHWEKYYVHRNGVITEDNSFGRCTGGGIIPLAVMVYFLILLQSVIAKYCEGVKSDMYSYRNVLNLGMIIYLAFLIIGDAPYMMSRSSVIEMCRSILDSAMRFAGILLPIAFVVFLLVSLSNLRLMRKEGRNWRNMLGFALGLLICVGTLVPFALGEFLQRTTIVDVHNENGLALYVEILVENGILAIVSYLECILS